MSNATKDKMKINIFLPNQKWKVGKYKIDGKKAVILKGDSKGGKPAYTVDYDTSCIVRKGIFNTPHMFLVYGAEACISFKDKSAYVPFLSTKAIRKLFDSGVLKNAGVRKTKIDSPLFYMMLLLMAIMIFLQYLLLSGVRLA